MRHETRRRGATIIEYLSTDDRLFIWVLQPNGKLHGTSSRTSRADLTRKVDATRATFASGDDARERLRQLYELLIAPVAPLLPSDRDQLVTIVPHGPLFLLPFAALLNNGNRYLVDDHTLSYIPSLSLLRYTATNRAPLAASAARIMTVGNPVMPGSRGDEPRLPQLPWGDREAREISGFYPQSRVTRLSGASAAERAIRDLAPEQTVLHFATHTMLYDSEPMAGYVALSPDAVPVSKRQLAEADGFLSLAEIFGLRLRADLVSLSACTTGGGRLSGDGIAGLSQALLYAGAASVVMNLWPVSDDVEMVQMKRFYEGLVRQRADKAEALAAAQRETLAALRSGRLSTPAGRKLEEHPGLWAPFVIAGEAR
jgi:CHAT domain-containing protein